MRPRIMLWNSNLMKLTLTLTKQDLSNLREFEKGVERQLGKTYVSGDYVCHYYDLPKELKAMLRPVAGNSFLDRAALLELHEKLESGPLTFELNSSKEVSKL